MYQADTIIESLSGRRTGTVAADGERRAIAAHPAGHGVGASAV